MEHFISVGQEVIVLFHFWKRLTTELLTTKQLEGSASQGSKRFFQKTFHFLNTWVWLDFPLQCDQLSVNGFLSLALGCLCLLFQSPAFSSSVTRTVAGTVETMEFVTDAALSVQ